MTTLIDRYAAAGAAHCRPGRLDRPVGAGLAIAVAAAVSVAVAAASGMGWPSIGFAAAGVLVWYFGLRLGLWRMAVGLAIIIACWLAWVIVVMLALTLFYISQGSGIQEALEQLNLLVATPSPAGILFRLLTFAGIWPGAWAALALLHKQRFGTLFAPEGRIRWGDYAGGLLLAAVFALATLAVNTALVGLPARTELSLGNWLTVLGPLLVLLFFQASGEELVFRGYMLQQLAARYRSPLVWGFLPAFLFGLAHYSNGTEIGLGWHYVAVTALVGMAGAALVWRTGSLAMAMGLHTGMNISSLLVVGLEGILDGTQLFRYGGADAPTLFLTDGAASLVLLLFVVSPLFPARSRAAAAT